MFLGPVTAGNVKRRGGELLSGRTNSLGSAAQRRPSGGGGGAKANEEVSSQ